MKRHKTKLQLIRRNRGFKEKGLKKSLKTSLQNILLHLCLSLFSHTPLHSSLTPTPTPNRNTLQNKNNNNTNNLSLSALGTELQVQARCTHARTSRSSKNISYIFIITHHHPTPPQKPDTRALPLLHHLYHLYHHPYLSPSLPPSPIDLSSSFSLYSNIQNDHFSRLLPRHDRNAATLRRHDTRLRFRQMVENFLPGPMLRHKPLRRSLRSPSTLLPLHLLQQPLPDELPLHRRGHAAEGYRLGGADDLVQREQEGVFGMDHNAVLHLHPPQHARDGHSVTEGDVRRVLREFDGPNSGPPVHHLVHLDALHVRVQRRQNADL